MAEELHFGRAARRLNVAQPAVSQLVRGLEAELGLQLFERSSRHVSLTSAGEVLAEEATELIAFHDRLLERMHRLRTGDTGQVGVGTVPALPPDVIPSLLTQWRERLPNVVVVARSLPAGRSAADALERSDIDIAIVRGISTDPGIESVGVAREPVGVAVASSDALAGNGVLRATDLEGRAIVSFPRQADPAEFDRLFGALTAQGLRSYTLQESAPGGVEASLRLVLSAQAVSLKLESEVRAMRDDRIVWVPLVDPQLDVVISATWRPDRLTPTGLRLVQLMREMSDAPSRGHPAIS